MAIAAPANPLHGTFAEALNSDGLKHTYKSDNSPNLFDFLAVQQPGKDFKVDFYDGAQTNKNASQAFSPGTDRSCACLRLVCNDSSTTVLDVFSIGWSSKLIGDNNTGSWMFLIWIGDDAALKVSTFDVNTPFAQVQSALPGGFIAIKGTESADIDTRDGIIRLNRFDTEEVDGEVTHSASISAMQTTTCIVAHKCWTKMKIERRCSFVCPRVSSCNLRLAMKVILPSLVLVLVLAMAGWAGQVSRSSAPEFKTVQDEDDFGIIPTPDPTHLGMTAFPTNTLTAETYSPTGTATAFDSRSIPPTSVSAVPTLTLTPTVLVPPFVQYDFPCWGPRACPFFSATRNDPLGDLVYGDPSTFMCSDYGYGITPATQEYTSDYLIRSNEPLQGLKEHFSQNSTAVTFSIWITPDPTPTGVQEAHLPIMTFGELKPPGRIFDLCDGYDFRLLQVSGPKLAVHYLDDGNPHNPQCRGGDFFSFKPDAGSFGLTQVTISIGRLDGDDGMDENGYDGGYIRAYVNGTSVLTDVRGQIQRTRFNGKMDKWDSTGHLELFTPNPEGYYPDDIFAGAIHRVTIYDRGLSDKEVQDSYHSGLEELESLATGGQSCP